MIQNSKNLSYDKLWRKDRKQDRTKRDNEYIADQNLNSDLTL